ncbi:glycoside hydrolase superfamily [Tribonema minus]|uniref:Glycoside hydrolase superfamily n=1 Tax=Tribonema minus TaxID=303371 RepID=A0A836CMH4_9STRA|nr:glycoside hydrolase superfamily [Tribonema minus]
MDFFDINKKIKWNLDVLPALKEGKQYVMVMEFFTGTPALDDTAANLSDIAYTTAYDDRINRFADQIIQRGNSPNIWIRPLHEMNGNWYSWGVFRKGNDNQKGLYIDAFRKVHKMMRKRGVAAKFQLAYNCNTNPDEGFHAFSEWYPGPEYVDMVVCSGYNRAGVSGRDYWVTFTEMFTNGYNQMLTLPDNKPLGLGETGSSAWKDYDRAQWITDAFNDLYFKFTRVAQVDWFFHNKAPVSGDWGLSKPKEIKAFSESVLEYS